MGDFFAQINDVLQSAFTNFSFVNIVEIIAYALVIYFALAILKTNNAKPVIWYYCIFTILSGAIIVSLDAKNHQFNGAPYMLALQMMFVVSVIVLFATEVKRAIWDSRRAVEFRYGDNKDSRNDANYCIEEIIKAVQNMSKNDVGAIIILSNGSLPNGVLESGVYLDSNISSQLIESIFFPKSALHDGAMILYGNRIQAAGCFLPLAQEVNLSKELGSRHRAGIGLTETINVTAIIVSEETGIISIAKSGKIVRYVDTNTLRETLKLFYWKDLID